MKARVKATGEMVQVIAIDGDWLLCSDGVHYGVECLEGIDDPDYWTRLEHQYAGMAMQGLCANSEWNDSSWEIIAEDAINAAHALVQKLNEKEE